MKTRRILGVLILALLFSKIALGLEGAFVDERRVSYPAGTVDSEKHQTGSSITANGLVLAFHSDRAGSPGERDLFLATRNTPEGPFETIRALAEINDSALLDSNPNLSPDGRKIYFGRSLWRPDDDFTTDGDLFAATRDDISEVFSSADAGVFVNINTAAYEADPNVTADGLVLVFARRSDSGGPFDLFEAVRESISEPFGVARPLDELNGLYDETAPSLSGDGTVLFFGEWSSPRASPKRWDIWVARRESRDQPFSTPYRLPAPVNGGRAQIDPFISPEWPAPGSKIYFSRWENGSFDMWQAAWNPDDDSILHIGTDDRPVQLFVPESYDPAVPMPLVLLLHAFTGTGQGNENRMQIRRLAESRGFFYAYPDGTIDPDGNPFWDATDACCNFASPPVDDSGYLRGVIEDVGANLNLDRMRIFIIGFSNGGSMCYRMACDHADVVAAIAGLSGASFGDSTLCTPATSVHVLEVHGTEDSIVPYDGVGAPGINPGAIETVERWALYNGCSLERDTSAPPLDLDSDLPGAETCIVRYTTNCNSGGSAELWTMSGGSHSDPYSAIVAELAIDWLLDHPKVVPPRARFSIEPDQGTPPLEVTLDAGESEAPEGLSIVTYEWDFGDGSPVEEGVTASHTYTKIGSHHIDLTVRTDGAGRTGSARGEITVNCESGDDLLPWTATDLGDPRYRGGASRSGECLSLCAGGAGIGGTNDEGFFLFQELEGDTAIIAEISDVSNSRRNSAVGVMLREGQDSGARFGSMLFWRGRSFQSRFVNRLDEAASTTVEGQSAAQVPTWVRIVRRNEELIGSTSTDGENWTEVARNTFDSFAPVFYGGLAAVGSDTADSGNFYPPLTTRVCHLEVISRSDCTLDEGSLDPDCNGNGLSDLCEIRNGFLEDENGDEIPDECELQFRRGAVRGEGAIDISDAIGLLGFLFLGSDAPPCRDAADGDDSGELDISDAVRILGYLFLGTGAPPAPGPLECGRDPTADTLGCESATAGC